jgi:hypothetical protein
VALRTLSLCAGAAGLDLGISLAVPDWDSKDFHASGNMGGPVTTKEQQGARGGGCFNLAEHAQKWPTPRAITGGGESAERKRDLGRTEWGGSDLQAATVAAMIHLCLEELLPLVKEAIAEHKEQIDWRQRYREEVYGW